VSSLLARTVVLSVSRFASQAIVLISPLLLVRILPVEEYGQYREFLVYAGMIGAFVTFGVHSSLVYLIPRHPERERTWITQTALFTLASSTLAVIVIYLAGDLLRGNTSFDFVTALQLYILFFANLDFLECYWLSKKRTDNVLYYSLTHLVARMSVVVISAYLTEDAESIVLALVVLESIRFLLVLLYANWRHWFTLRLSRQSLNIQSAYFLPLGAGLVVEVMNRQGGALFISIVMGAEALAFFVIGAFATQIINILRGAIADVIFPEIVEMRHANPKDALPLWKKATVWYCILLFPTAGFLGFYSDAIVTVLFTSEYASAIPVFSVFAMLLLIECFDFALPLRVQNANRYFLFANITALGTNIGLLYPAYTMFGLLGPAVALIVSRLVFTAYLARQAKRIYKVDWAELVDWGLIARVGMAVLICLPILVVGTFLPFNYWLRILLFGAMYYFVYLILLRWFRVWDGWVPLKGALRARKQTDV